MAIVGAYRMLERVGLGRAVEHRVLGRGRGAGVLWASLRVAKASCQQSSHAQLVSRREAWEGRRPAHVRWAARWWCVVSRTLSRSSQKQGTGHEGIPHLSPCDVQPKRTMQLMPLAGTASLGVNMRSECQLVIALE